MKKTKSEKMLTVWTVVFALTCIVFGIFKIVLSVCYGYATDEVLGLYHVMVTVVVFVFFFPMLFAICHFAKKEGNKTILVAAIVLLDIVIPWVVMNCITIIRELINR